MSDTYTPDEPKVATGYLDKSGNFWPEKQHAESSNVMIDLKEIVFNTCNRRRFENLPTELSHQLVMSVVLENSALIRRLINA